MFSRIMDKKYQIVGIISLFSGLAGCYFYFRTKSNSEEKQKQQKDKSITFQQGELLFESKSNSQANHGLMEKWSSLYSQFYFDKNLESRKVLDHLDNEGISVETIYKYSPLIAADEFKKFTAEIRRRRRLIRTFSEDQYIRLIMDYEQEVDELLQRSRQQIIYECEIDQDQFSNMKVIFEATEDLTFLIREAKKSLKSISYTKKRAIPKQTLQKIVNEEISFIKSKLYQRLRNKLQNELNLSQDEILRIIQALIEDIIYQKFGYEKEQIDYSLNVEWKKDLQKEIKELKKHRSQLESDIGNNNVQSQQSEDESEKGRDPLSQGMTQSGVNSSFVQDQENLK